MRLGDVFQQRDDRVRVLSEGKYPIAGVYGFGRGLFARAVISGTDTSYKELHRLHAGDFVISRVKAWEGAVGVVPPELDGHYVSKEFPSFSADLSRVDPRWVKFFFDSEDGRHALTSCTKGLGARRERVKEEALLNISLPSLPVAAQRAVVERLEALDRHAGEARELQAQVEREQASLLLAVFDRISRQGRRVRLGEVAPLERRPVVVGEAENYPQVSVRSFGRGTFHKPPLAGSEITWEKPFRVEQGDLLISNIKAWEGAIAVARDVDHGRFASHRYLTCVPKPGVVTAQYICFYLLTAEGLHHVGEASPGSADRNRTLGAKALQNIPVPLPSFEHQRWFDTLRAEIDGARRIQAEVSLHRDALVPALVQRSFRMAVIGA